MLSVETQASVLNFPPRAVMLGTAAVFETFITETQHDGLQYVPVRTPLLGRFDELADDGLITSFHQSWAHGRDVANRAALSGLKASLRRIEDLQHRLPQGRRVPTVVHPNGQLLGGKLPGGEIDYGVYSGPYNHGALGLLLHQPTVEVLETWGLLSSGAAPERTARNLEPVQHYYGFSGIALDLHHLTTKRGHRQLSPDWVDRFVTELAALGRLRGPSEVQVSLRPDFGGSPDDISMLMNRQFADTRAAQLLRIVREGLPADQEKLRITAEVPAQAFDGYGGYIKGNLVLREAVLATLAG